MNAKHKTHEENKTRHITIYLLKISEKVEMLRAARGKKKSFRGTKNKNDSKSPHRQQCQQELVKHSFKDLKEKNVSRQKPMLTGSSLQK